MKIHRGGELGKRFQQEAASFDKIALDRADNGVIPDLRAEFVNEYFYNNIWRNSLFLQEEFGPLCQWIVDTLKHDGVTDVFELGCGNGWLSLELARAGFNVTGLDLSPEQIDFAKRHAASVKDRRRLSLRYECRNIVNLKDYNGASVVCFGFLHHLPPPVLETLMAFLKKRMRKGQLVVAVEPRHDHSSWNMALLIYALRLALPNHFKYPKSTNIEMGRHVQEIFDDLSEAARSQSEMDRESDSDAIEAVLKKHFRRVEARFTTAFYDKWIGSVRLKDKADIKEAAVLFKKIDELIMKYNPSLARRVLLKAYR